MKHVLVFDIGGTHLRMAQGFVAGCEVRLDAIRHAQTRDFHNSVDLWSYYSEDARASRLEKPDAVCLAAAAPVNSERVMLSNARLELDRSRLERLFAAPTALVNDYAAAAFSLETRARSAQIWGNSPDHGKVRAVAGAGTGFGEGMLLPGGVFVSSEGGHALFPFAPDEDERAFEAFLLEYAQLKRAEVDDVVSGRGLEALTAFVTGTKMAAGEAAQRHLADTDEDGNRVGRLFSRFYARACRTFALSTMCAGGLWLAGSLAMRNMQLVRSRAFHDEFVLSHGQHEEFLRAIPVSVFTDPHFSLKGAARIAGLVAEQKPLHVY